MTQDIDDLIASYERNDAVDLAEFAGKCVAALRAQRDEIARIESGLLDAMRGLSEQSQMREQAEAERDAAMKDAERINWLDENPREATIRIGGDMKACVFYGVSCDQKWSARAAIDAAIAKGNG